MNSRRRGFTLIELLIVVAVTSIVMGALGHLHLETRVSAARLEADLVMERSTSLVAAWVSRLGRGAEEIRATDRGIEFVLYDGQRVELFSADRRLIELRGEEKTMIARHIDGLGIEEQAGSWVVEIRAVRPLIDGAEQRRVRSLRIPRWRR
jgi:prepilin-type N-terminal cleavage/methylation domain-containing protein